MKLTIICVSLLDAAKWYHAAFHSVRCCHGRDMTMCLSVCVPVSQETSVFMRLIMIIFVEL